MLTAQMASNVNFPAALGILTFLAAFAGAFLALASAGIAWFERRPKFVRGCFVLVVGGGVCYFALLFGFSLVSSSHVLGRNQEKYFCEIDCHLAYSVLDVRSEPAAGAEHYVVTIRTRFDESTISPSRPKDAPLTPSPRTVCLVDASGHQYLPVAVQGTPLLTALTPGESYDTRVGFDLPPQVKAQNLRLLITTTPAWPDLVVIGDENSWLHGKTYFAL
ncbi:MAG: hypothetical protein ACLQLC_15940 [Candidatus Sulfotelmatobacter sp.]